MNLSISLTFLGVLVWLVIYKRIARLSQLAYVIVFFTFQLAHLNFATTPSPDIEEYLDRFSTEKTYLEFLYYGFGRLIISEYRDMALFNVLLISSITAASWLLLDRKSFQVFSTTLIVFSTTYIYIAGVLNIHRQWCAALILLFLGTLSKNHLVMGAAALFHYSAIVQVALSKLSEAIKKTNVWLSNGVILSASFLLGCFLSALKSVHNTGRDFGLYFLAGSILFCGLTRLKFKFQKRSIWASSLKSQVLSLAFAGMFWGLIFSGAGASVERLFLFYMLFVTAVIVESSKNWSGVTLAFWSILNSFMTAFLSPMRGLFL